MAAANFLSQKEQGPISEVRFMDIKKHRAKVLKNVASLPGGRDRHGGPLIVIESTNLNVNKSASTTELNSVHFPYEDLVSLLGYLSEIADKNAASKGFCVLIDARKSSPKTLKNILRACQQALYRKQRVALIVQPERFLDQQKINMDLLLEGYEFKTLMLSVHKLSKYIDISQLPESLGGTYSYEAEEWCNNRERIELVLHQLAQKLHEVESSEGARIQDDMAIKEGEVLAAELCTSISNSENLAASKSIRQAIGDIKAAAARPELEAKAQREAAEAKERNEMLDEHSDGVNRLLDWIEGPGEKWLFTLHEIGESRDEARQLVKDHEQLAVKSEEVLNQSKELAELATRLMAAVPAHAITLEKTRDQVRLVAQQFCNRVDRQTNMAKRSEQFHGLVSDLARKTDLLLQSLCTDPKVADLAAAEAEKTAMEEKVSVMEKIYESVSETGGNFIDDLAANEYDMLGRKVVRDYSTGIVHIRDQLAAARERRRRCLDLVDVRRLKLQQFVQLFTCENDANQAIQWLEELHETLLRDYNQIGCDEKDLHILREDRMKLEETARSTYEYGKQLCQVGMVLRRSLRLDGQPQSMINDKLEQTWGRLCRALSENEARLNVTDAFNATIVEINRRIDEIERRSRDKLLPGSNRENVLQTERRRLSGDIKELSHIRDMLGAQINANHNATVEARQTAIASIRRKVDDVEMRHRKMESLFIETPPSPREAPPAPTMPNRSSEKSVLAASNGIGSIRLSDTESYL